MKIVQILVVAGFVVLMVGAAYREGDKMAWDQVTTDVNGDPEVVVSAEAAAFAVGGTVPVASEAGLSPAGTGWDMAPLVQQLSEGTYQFAVRVIDEAGNISDWSNKVQLRVDRTPPAAPGGCRIFR